MRTLGDRGSRRPAIGAAAELALPLHPPPAAGQREAPEGEQKITLDGRPLQSGLRPASSPGGGAYKDVEYPSVGPTAGQLPLGRGAYKDVTPSVWPPASQLPRRGSL